MGHLMSALRNLNPNENRALDTHTNAVASIEPAPLAVPPSDPSPTALNTYVGGDKTTIVAPTETVSSVIPPGISHTVFISHAGEDKATIAIPMREKLRGRGITAFVDKKDMPPGTDSVPAMYHAMARASIAVIVLSPEFVAREWPMKELMYFLERRRKYDTVPAVPILIPFFYRLSVAELYDEPRLKRKDEDGNLLFRKTRFFERQKNGEPEANIPKIKAALMTIRGIMGIRNDNDASNDSSYLMSLRREKLLEGLCDEIQKVVPDRSVKNAANGTTVRGLSDHDEFRAYFATFDNTSDLMFDFHAKDESGSASTQEGKLLEILLDTSKNLQRSIAVQGMAGVGKTSLLQGIAGLEMIKEHFTDGVYSFSLGISATRRDLTEAMIRAVRSSGGEQKADAMRTQTDFKEMTEQFRSWFENKRCLFLVDDVWENKEISSGTIDEILKFHKSARESKMLLTTKSVGVAAMASYFGLEPRGPLTSESRAILLHFSGIKLEDGQDEGKKVVDQILKRCGGLPLLLVVAGKAVKALTFRRGHNGCLAYHAYSKLLEASAQPLLTTNIGWYKGLSEQLKISINLLEKRRKDFVFPVSITIAEVHRRLSVVTKHTRIPMTTLKWLWGLEDDSQAATIARELENVGLADVDYETTKSGYFELLRLHDSIYEFAVTETQKHRDDVLGHTALLNGYSQKLSFKGACREWWHSSMESDGYIHRNLCRHLLAAGQATELVRLLLAPQWVERQLEINGILIVKEDFATGIRAVQDGKVDESHEELRELEQVLQLISEAAALSSAFVVGHRSETFFQLHARLRGYAAKYNAIGEYVCRIEVEAPRPLALSMNNYLKQPGGPNVTIIPVGNPVNCMAVLNDKRRIACGCGDGKVVIVNILQRGIQKQWQAHDESVKSIAVSRNGAVVVSGSADRTAKVWNVGTGRCVTTFVHHKSVVKFVGIADDEKHAISCSADGSVQVWNMESGDLVSKLFQGLRDSTVCATVSRDGGHIAVGGRNGKIRRWSMTGGAHGGVAFSCNTPWLQSIAIAPHAQLIVTGFMNGILKVWDTVRHEQIGTAWKAHSRGINCVTISRDGSRIVSGSEDREIRLWDRDSGEEVCEPLVGHAKYVTDVSFLAGNDSIVSCSADGTVREWDVRRKNPEELVTRYGYNASSISFLLNGKFVVLGSGDTSLRIKDVESGYQVGDPMQGHSKYVSDIAVTADGKRVVSVSKDKTVGVWDLETRKLLHRLSGHTDWILCVAVIPTCDRAVTGSKDKTVRIWNLSGAESSYVLGEHTAAVESVFVTDDGQQIVSVDKESNIYVWILKKRTLVKQLRKENAWKLSRREVLRFVGVATVHDDTELSIPKNGRRVIYGKEPYKQVLATMDADILAWALSPDKTLISIGLSDGRVAFLKLER